MTNVKCSRYGFICYIAINYVSSKLITLVSSSHFYVISKKISPSIWQYIDPKSLQLLRKFIFHEYVISNNPIIKWKIRYTEAKYYYSAIKLVIIWCRYQWFSKMFIWWCVTHCTKCRNYYCSDSVSNVYWHDCCCQCNK